MQLSAYTDDHVYPYKASSACLTADAFVYISQMMLPTHTGDGVCLYRAYLTAAAFVYPSRCCRLPLQMLLSTLTGAEVHPYRCCCLPF
jgi:hypothetical protein